MMPRIKRQLCQFCKEVLRKYAVICDLCIIHSSYFISGFGAGNKMIDLLCSHIGIVQVVINYLLFNRNIQCFTMAMPFNMILILYVMLCDFSKITIFLFIHVHNYILSFL